MQSLSMAISRGRAGSSLMTAAASTAWAVSLMPVVMTSTVSLNPQLKLLRDVGRTVEKNLQDGGRLRPVDLARGHGLSTQAVRNYEAAGIPPGAQRTPHRYRTYTPLPAQALRAFLALVPGPGPPRGRPPLLHGVSIGIRRRYPSWSRRRVR